MTAQSNKSYYIISRHETSHCIIAQRIKSHRIISRSTIVQHVWPTCYSIMFYRIYAHHTSKSIGIEIKFCWTKSLLTIEPCADVMVSAAARQTKQIGGGAVQRGR